MPFDRACWVEPVNTCLKGVELLDLRSDDTVAVLGQGPIGLVFTMLVGNKGANVLEPIPLLIAVNFPNASARKRSIRYRTTLKGLPKTQPAAGV